MNRKIRSPLHTNHTVRINRLMIYPFVLILFMVVTNLYQKYTGDVSRSTGVEYFYLKPDFERQNNFDVTFYHLYLKVEIDTSISRGLLNGEAGIRFSAKTESIQEIVLNLSSNLVVDSIVGAKNFSHKNNFLTIRLNKTIEVGEQGEVRVRYHGWPRPYHRWIYGWALKKNPNPVLKQSPWISTINPPFGAQTWFPCKDDPSDKADSVRFTIDVPDSLDVICNGRLVEEIDLPQGRKQVVWAEKYPIATYLMTTHIGRYFIYPRAYVSPTGTSFPLQIYCFDSDSALVELVFNQLEYMLDYYTEMLGDYPFAPEKYAMIISPMKGGMENQTISSVFQINSRSENLYAHELVHQWLGDLVGYSTFSDAWIAEGLATYFTALYLKHTQGESAFKYFMNSRKFLGEGRMQRAEIHIPESVYNSGPVYGKSSWFYYMLHNRIGDEAFFAGIRRMLQQYRFKTISADQLQRIFEQVSGEDLGIFFSQWIKEKTVPDLDCNLILSSVETDGVHYLLKVHQKQKSEKPFRLPLELKFLSGEKEKTKIVELVDRNQKFQLIMPWMVELLEVNPSGKILMTANVLY